MCGIAGFCNFRQDYLDRRAKWEDVLCGMHRSLQRRGEDDAGIFLDSSVGMAHARLSIRDIERGKQPMTRTVFGHRATIVYNGEIYNTDELLPPLVQAGYRFTTTSDTEILLYAFLAYGAGFVTKLNGIFAIAIWDHATHRLFCYRDRAGVKPLFYAQVGDTFLFGSEPKALFCHPDYTPALDRDGLREILAVGPARTPGFGVFSGMKELLPGHEMCVEKEGITTSAYWSLTAAEHTDDYAETVEKTSFLVRDAIRRQMVSDVPVCSFLSGGIDSSIVTSVAASYLREQGKTLDTFSFDFTDNDLYFQSNRFQPERDLPYVKIMQEYCGSHHRFLECDVTTLFDLLPCAVDAKDLPGMTDVDASLLYFCSIVAEHNKVCLTGECADEIFGGYPWFYRPELLNQDAFPWSYDLTARTALLSDDVVRSLALFDYAKETYESALREVPHLPEETAEEHRRRNVSYLNLKWFMQTLLDRMDRTSMYSGLEARVPFADHRIIAYLFNVPWSMKYRNLTEKALLRDACADLLPPELLMRKKSPYPKTYHPGYERLLSARFEELLHDTNAPVYPLLDQAKASAFLAAPKELGKPWFGQLMAGPQLLAYLIQINDWMQKYQLSLPRST